MRHAAHDDGHSAIRTNNTTAAAGHAMTATTTAAASTGAGLPAGNARRTLGARPGVATRRRPTASRSAAASVTTSASSSATSAPDTRPISVAEPPERPYVARVCSDEWLDRFNQVYRDAQGEIDAIPWSHEHASPSLVRWLDEAAPGLVPHDARVAVVGCGLGADAVELVDRGYDVTAFDACVEAVRWARRRNPGLEHIFRVVDVLTLPDGMRERFDLVVEVHTLQALPPEFRQPLARGMADLLAPGGVLVAIARGRQPSTKLDLDAGPPYAFTPAELNDTLRAVGLVHANPVDERLDNNRPPVRRLTATARRPAR